MHQGPDRMKATITEKKQKQKNRSHDSQPWVTQRNYELYHAEPPKADGSWWKVLTKCAPLEEGMANHISILALRSPWTGGKGKKTWQLKRNSPGQHEPNMLLEKSREIAQEGMKRLSQAKITPSCGCVWWWTKVQNCKEQYWIGTWNFRSMNQGKLEVVKQEMARVNINILAISELKWTGMGKFNTDDHYIYCCGQESLGRNGVALTVNKRVQNAVLGCNLKTDRIILVHFQDKPFNITLIQV